MAMLQKNFPEPGCSGRFTGTLTLKPPVIKCKKEHEDAILHTYRLQCLVIQQGHRKQLLMP